MIIDGFALAVVTTLSLMLLFARLPPKAKAFIKRHSFGLDLLACVFTYMILGGTLVALFAGAFVGIMVSMMLYIQANQEDFQYLFDLRDFISDQIANLKVKLNQMGETYKAAQANKAVEA
jgi:hypothetical protein